MTDNRTTELQSLSKLKMAGKLRYWRGTIEIPESELHAICDEIQAEHDRVIAATLGNQIDADLRKAIDFMRIWIVEDAHLGESAISRELEKAEGLRKLDAIEQAIAATLGEKPRDKTDEWLFKACNQATQDYVAQLEQERDELKSKLEAERDELNAELGSGTCIMSIDKSRIGDDEIESFVCSICGYETFRQYTFGNDGEFVSYPEPNYCPHCGALRSWANEN